VDRIVIEGIEVWAQHGVLLHERALGQRFVIDVALEVDLAPAIGSDLLEDTVDYGTLAADIHALVADDPVELVESLAGRVAERCLEDERVQACQVAVHKPSAPLTVPVREVRVEIRRER
jgi:7,8-dihydroneopterin aldolase/epimerase/oxygenase